MPKSPAKKSAKPVKKSSKPAVKAKAKAKPKSPVVSAPAASERGFMWKILQKKQERLKQAELHPANPHKAPMTEASQPDAESRHGFSRFNGPRRRAG